MPHDNGDATSPPPRPPRNRRRRPRARRPHRARADPDRHVRLGEELPIFCERCGYSLHGLPQVRCGACDVLHFACPECNHHQPINTLRPAFQRMLGRLRVVRRWRSSCSRRSTSSSGRCSAGARWDRRSPTATTTPGPRRRATLRPPRGLQIEGGLIIFMFALGFGMVAPHAPAPLAARRAGGPGDRRPGRTGDLRRRVPPVPASCCNTRPPSTVPAPRARPCSPTCSAASPAPWPARAIVWGIWLSFVHVFLPKRAAHSLLEWQRAMSAPPGAPDRTDATTSVIA